jgi:hypothetical protein
VRGDTSPLSRNSCYATRLAKPSHFRVWAFEWVFRAGLSSPVFPNLVFPRRSPGLHPKSRRPGAQRIECPFSLRLGPGSDPPSPTSPFVGSDRIWPTFYSYPQRNGIGARSGRSQFVERSGKASRHSRRMAYCHMARCHMPATPHVHLTHAASWARGAAEPSRPLCVAMRAVLRQARALAAQVVQNLFTNPLTRITVEIR